MSGLRVIIAKNNAPHYQQVFITLNPGNWRYSVNFVNRLGYLQSILEEYPPAQYNYHPILLVIGSYLCGGSTVSITETLRQRPKIVVITLTSTQNTNLDSLVVEEKELLFYETLFSIIMHPQMQQYVAKKDLQGVAVIIRQMICSADMQAFRLRHPFNLNPHPDT